MKDDMITDNEIYKENILDHYKNPRNRGELKKYTIKQKQVNPLCGDEIEIYIQIEDKKIKEISFKGKGCAISIAATSIITEYVKDKNRDQIKKVSQSELEELIHIKPSIVRLKCMMLGLNTIKGALEEC